MKTIFTVTKNGITKDFPSLMYMASFHNVHGGTKGIITLPNKEVKQ